MTVDDPADPDAADDPVRHRGRSPDVETAETRDREECYRDLRARDREPGRPPPLAARPDGVPPGDDRWSWKGLELGRDANRVADEGLAARRRAEGRDADGHYGEEGITPAMRRIEAELEHGILVPDTERFALKSPDRFKEKLAKMIRRYPDQACDRLVSAIHDGIRYTFLFPADHYTAGVANATQALMDHGYDLRGRKPSWDKEDYRGVNSRWREADSGLLFEVQFHTPESWEAKQKTHDVYEKLCDVTITPREHERLEEQQRQIVSAIPVPPGAENISFYEKVRPDDRE